MKMFNMRYWLSGGESKECSFRACLSTRDQRLMNRFITKPLNRSFDLKEGWDVADDIVSIIPFATFSLFHTLTFIRTNILPKFIP